MLNKTRSTARKCAVQNDGAVALVVTADESDRLFVTNALQALGWKLRFARDGREARAALDAESIPIMIVDGDAQVPCWRQLLGRRLETGSKIIVISHCAEERLWAEVLNCGAYDLVPKPLNTEELVWVVNSALVERNGSYGSGPDGVVEPRVWNSY